MAGSPRGARRQAVGRYGEDLACRALVEAGMVVLARNWRCSAGELDIIAADGSTLVVCEVKTRQSDAFGTPQEAVTATKLRRLRTLAAQWLESQTQCDRIGYAQVRIDVVAVMMQPRGAAAIEHLRGVGW